MIRLLGSSSCAYPARWNRSLKAILRELRLRELRTLSVADARAQYDDLGLTWQTRLRDLGAALERQAIEHRVALRRRLAGRR